MESLVELHRRVSGADDPNVGKAKEEKNNSISGVVSTLIPILIVSGVMFAIFIFMRSKQQRLYAPRTYLGALREHERSPKLPTSLFGWLPVFQKIPDIYVLQHSSLDGYFLLRFLKIVTTICLVGCLLTWPILFPINITGGKGLQQLDKLTFGNVANTNKYYAHVFVAWIFISFVFFMVTRECIYFINMRQAYLLSPAYSTRLSSRTVLFTSVPEEYNNEHTIRRMFGAKLRNLWISTDVDDLEDKVDERNKVSMKLEAAETKLIRSTNDARLKSLKKGDHRQGGQTDHNRISDESGSAAAQWITPKQRPTHKLKFLIGKKVDTINWCRSELQRLIPEVEHAQEFHRSGNAKTTNYVMVEFYNQSEAQAAYQMVAHHLPLHMTPRLTGVHPDEIIWINGKMTWKTRNIRNIISIAIMVATIVFWSFPVAFVGMISNINKLIEIAPFLEFLNAIPGSIKGVVTGLLPAVMLAILMALLPIWLKFLAMFAGVPTLSQVELRLQKSYFWFQVIHVFLITTLSSSITESIQIIIDDPVELPTLLAENIPGVGNFYLSFIIVQGLTYATAALLQIAALVLFKVLSTLLDSTPRKLYSRWTTLTNLSWGKIFPIVTNLAVIAITYSVIAPLVLGFATIGLALFYFAFRYNLLFVNAPNIDTKGEVYPTALKQLFVGCYIAILCLIGLFGLTEAFGPLVLMVIFGVFCALFHLSLSKAIDPLLHYLPRSLEAEEESFLQAEEGKHSPHDEGSLEKSHAINSTPHKKPGMFAKFFRPHIYTDYSTLRRLFPRDIAPTTMPEWVAREAYHHPAIKDHQPLLWVPRDESGVSRQECAHTSRVTPMTDEGAYLNEKGKVEVVKDHTAPIHEDKIYY